MKLANNFNKLLKNRLVLYVVVFLAVTNVLGYFSMRDMNAITFFALIGFLAHQFTKNMIVVLLTAMLATNLLMSNSIREGLAGKKDEKEGEEEEEDEKEGETEEPYVDKAATAKENYAEFEAQIGGEGMKQITKETKELLNQQKELMTAMEGMGPVMQQASNLMTQFEGMKKVGGEKKKQE